MGRPLRAALSALIAVLAATSAAADVIHVRNGPAVEGKVVRETPSEVVIDATHLGRQTIPRARIVRIEYGPSTREVLEAKRKALDPKDAAACFELGRWCAERRLKPEAESFYRMAVAADPEHEDARRALGHVRFEGRWMTPEEAERVREQRFAEEQRRKGLELYEGKWVPKEEAEARRRGLVRFGDEWVTPEEAMRRRGFVPFEGGWIHRDELAARREAAALGRALGASLGVVERDRFSIRHDVPVERAKEVADALEALYADFARTFDLAPDANVFTPKCEVYLFERAPAYERFVEHVKERLGAEKVAPGWAASVKRQHNFWWTAPVQVSGHYRFPNTHQTMKMNVVHSVAHVLLNRYRFNSRMNSWWLIEGTGFWFERRAFGACDSFCVGRVTYAKQGDRAAKWQDTRAWPELLRQAVADAQDRPMRAVAAKSLNELDAPDLAKSWSVVAYLIERDRPAFLKFVEAARRRKPDEEEAALRETFRLGWDELDAAWREHVRRAPDPPDG